MGRFTEVCNKKGMCVLIFQYEVPAVYRKVSGCIVQGTGSFADAAAAGAPNPEVATRAPRPTPAATFQRLGSGRSPLGAPHRGHLWYGFVGLKALQTLGDASHFSIFSGARKEIPSSVKLTANSADPWCASALFPSGGTRPFVWGLWGGLWGQFPVHLAT